MEKGTIYPINMDGRTLYIANKEGTNEWSFVEKFKIDLSGLGFLKKLNTFFKGIFQKPDGTDTWLASTAKEATEIAIKVWGNRNNPNPQNQGNVLLPGFPNGTGQNNYNQQGRQNTNLPYSQPNQNPLGQSKLNTGLIVGGGILAATLIGGGIYLATRKKE